MEEYLVFVGYEDYPYVVPAGSSRQAVEKVAARSAWRYVAAGMDFDKKTPYAHVTIKACKKDGAERFKIRVTVKRNGEYSFNPYQAGEWLHVNEYDKELFGDHVTVMGYYGEFCTAKKEDSGEWVEYCEETQTTRPLENGAHLFLVPNWYGVDNKKENQMEDMQ